MSKFLFGTRFKIYDQEYEVTNAGIDTIRTATAGNRIKSFDRRVLERMLESGELIIDHDPALSNATTVMGAVITKGAAESEALSKRVHYVRYCLSHSDRPRSKVELTKLVPAAGALIGDMKPPSASTVALWIKRYVDSGRDERVLLSLIRRSRTMFKSLPPAVMDCLRTTIGECYLNKQRNPATSILPSLAEAIADLNLRTGERYRTPSIATVRRHIKRIDAYRRDVARLGKFVSNRKHRAAARSMIALTILEAVIADGQLLDLIIVDSKGRPIGRAYLTSMIDVKSRCVLAALVSLAPFCGATLLATLRKAVVPSGDAPRGLAEVLIVDNGADYRDNGFAHFCSQNHTIVEPCEPAEPNQKAIKERFFATLNTQLIHRLPGTTFSNSEDRGDYDSQAMAMMQLSEIQTAIDAFLVDYHRRPHEGLGGLAPLAVWKADLETLPVPPRTMSAAEAEICARTVLKGTVVNGRVQVLALPPYFSGALRAYEIDCRESRRKPEVEIRVDG